MTIDSTGGAMSHDVHTLSGAYALDALSPDEAEEFRRHLAGCQACCDEVRELRRAAARLGAGEAAAPPASLKTRVLGAVDRTPQVPPATSTSSVAPADGASVTQLSPRRRWTVRVAAAAAAVVLVAGGAIGLSSVLQEEEQSDPGLSAAAEQVFEAGDARTQKVPTLNGGSLVVGVSPSRGEMAVDTRGLPELDTEHIYQLWAVHDGEMTSAGLLGDPDEGAAMELPETGTQVAVTVEPASGSKQPTTEPVVVVDPAQV